MSAPALTDAAPPPPEHGAGDLASRLRALEADVDRLAAVDVAAMEGPAAAELHVSLRRLADRILAVAVQALPVAEADGRWALDGARSFPVWLASRTHGSVAAARRDVRLGRALRDELPLAAAAVTSGDVPLEHARILATVGATSDVRRQALADRSSPCDERFLMAHARLEPADHFRRLVSRWAAAADPESDDRGYRDAVDREFLDVARTWGGYHVAGFLTEEHGQALAVALAAVTPVPTADERRTSPQRRAQALYDLARLTLDHGMAGVAAAVRPHLSVHVDLEHLERLEGQGQAKSQGGADRLARHGPPSDRQSPPRGSPASPVDCPTFADGTPVPAAVLDRLACDSEVTRVVFGPGRAVLDVGRAQRTVRGQLRRAVVARDRHCRAPGCMTPPAFGEVHHPHHWARGGRTSVENAVLLCWHHHDWVHRNAVTITSESAGWVFRTRDGHVVEDPSG